MDRELEVTFGIRMESDAAALGWKASTGRATDTSVRRTAKAIAGGFSRSDAAGGKVEVEVEVGDPDAPILECA